MALRGYWLQIGVEPKPNDRVDRVRTHERVLFRAGDGEQGRVCRLISAEFDGFVEAHEVGCVAEPVAELPTPDPRIVRTTLGRIRKTNEEKQTHRI